MAIQEYIDAGRIVNTHGVRGEVKIEVWLDSPDYLKSFPRIFVGGKEYRLLDGFRQKHFLIASLEGVEDVNAAAVLKGRTVCVARADAKLPEGGYFLCELIGARVQREDGSIVGVVRDILEKPASDLYVVEDTEGREMLIPIIEAFIVSTDAAEGVITVRIPEGL